MHAATWIVLLVVLATVALATAHAWRRGRADLRAADEPSRRERTALDLDALEPRDLRPLSPSQRARYLDGWRGVEATFAADPEAGIALAEHISRDVAAELGYPVGSFVELAEQLSLDFPREIDAYCLAHAVAVANERRSVPHRQLRRAMRSYRAMFARLTEPERFAAAEAETSVEMSDRSRQL